MLQGNACNFPAIAVAFNAYTAPFCDHDIPFSLTVVPSSHVGCCTGETFLDSDLQKRVSVSFYLHIMYADYALVLCMFVLFWPAGLVGIGSLNNKVMSV